MASKGQRVVEVAEGELGRAESPRGSNCGGSERYQALWPAFGKCGWPWCGAFISWAWEMIVPGSHTYADPSTATMCSSKPNVSIQPGSGWVSCGVHVAVVRYSLGGGSYACIDGNHGDAVGFSTRSFSGGAQCVGPPWLGEGAEPEEPPERKWFYLQDPGAAERAGQREYYGGWGSKGSRDDAYDSLKRELGHELRKFADPDFEGEYLIDNSAFVTEIYGGWSSEGSRDSARETLEDRLGRTLRPFSEMRTPDQGGVPWNAKNLLDPFE